jgi:hypothetical protein
MYKLRDYQVDIANKGVNILKSKGIVYYALEVRLGKTSVSLETARLFGAKRVLFLTKKKAISSIESDYINFGYDKHFELFVHNDESMHKIDGKFDLVIHDEHHRFGSFPKPSLGAKTFKKMFAGLPMIFLSGTMSPESYSQLYHQFWVSNASPFRKYTNFYKWANDFVKIKKNTTAKDDSNEKEQIILAKEILCQSDKMVQKFVEMSETSLDKDILVKFGMDVINQAQE